MMLCFWFLLVDRLLYDIYDLLISFNVIEIFFEVFPWSFTAACSRTTRTTEALQERACLAGGVECVPCELGLDREATRLRRPQS